MSCAVRPRIHSCVFFFCFALRTPSVTFAINFFNESFHCVQHGWDATITIEYHDLLAVLSVQMKWLEERDANVGKYVSRHRCNWLKICSKLFWCAASWKFPAQTPRWRRENILHYFLSCLYIIFRCSNRFHSHVDNNCFILTRAKTKTKLRIKIERKMIEWRHATKLDRFVD